MSSFFPRRIYTIANASEKCINGTNSFSSLCHHVDQYQKVCVTCLTGVIWHPLFCKRLPFIMLHKFYWPLLIGLSTKDQNKYQCWVRFVWLTITPVQNQRCLCVPKRTKHCVMHILCILFIKLLIHYSVNNLPI